MKAIQFSPLVLGVALICGCATSPTKLHTTTSISELKCHPAYIYRLEGSTAVPVGSAKEGSSGLNHVTIVGAIESPGVYYFMGKASIENLITAAKPIETAEHCGSACLTQVTIMSSRRLKDMDSFMINYEKYLSLKGSSARVPIELDGGEVIYIPEWF